MSLFFKTYEWWNTLWFSEILVGKAIMHYGKSSVLQKKDFKVAFATKVWRCKRQEQITETKRRTWGGCRTFSSIDTKSLWDSMKSITNMKSNRIQLSTMGDQRRADELNNFFLRFKTQDLSQKGAEALDTMTTCFPLSDNWTRAGTVRL